MNIITPLSLRKTAFALFGSLVFFTGIFSADAAIVAHWKLDTNAVDNVGGHVSTLVGADYGFSSSDFVGGPGSLRLNPANNSTSHIFVNDAPDLEFATNDFTVSYWVKKMQLGSNFKDAYGIGKWKSGGGSPGQNEWTLNIESGASDNIPAFAVESGSTVYVTTASSNLTIGSWAHLVAERRQNTLRIYVNGTFEGSASLPPGTVFNTAKQGLYIGNSAALLYGANAFYDEVEIYNHALSDGGTTNIGQIAGGEIGFLYANPGAEIQSAASILTQPLNASVVLGGAQPVSASFTVAAGGTPPLSYQWRFNSNIITNATNATYTVTNITSNLFGFYDVIVTNSYGTAQSIPAKLGAANLSLQLIPGLTIEGTVGTSVRIDYSLDLSTWITLTNLTLPSNPYRYADFTAIGQPQRFYRAVFGP